MAQQGPRDIGEDEYYRARDNSFERGYRWQWSYYKSKEHPNENGHVYIVPPHRPPFVEDGMPGERLNFLWSQPGNSNDPHPKDRCHLTLQFTKDSFNLRNVHLTIAPGQYVALRSTKLSVERQNPQGFGIGPTTVTNLVNDTVNARKLMRAFRAILDAIHLRNDFKQPIRDNVGYINGADQWVWRPGADLLVLQQCQAMLAELQVIMADFGLGMNENIPNTFP
ncbi:hypothetical protein CCHR01_14137 [Colletotrichum chrysophilum]|uniref:Uncharacterized protein n=1 Tax=Colletotrichum chrysophilum TaxID=1836956 RepID=A0AAD9AD16_9PEZI|nr:hypothetical protein CCHR01_14137 [Colletotrichum chrysophilum]